MNKRFSFMKIALQVHMLANLVIHTVQRPNLKKKHGIWDPLPESTHLFMTTPGSSPTHLPWATICQSGPYPYARHDFTLDFAQYTHYNWGNGFLTLIKQIVGIFSRLSYTVCEHAFLFYEKLHISLKSNMRNYFFSLISISSENF